MVFDNLVDLYSVKERKVFFRHVHNTDLTHIAEDIESYRLEIQKRYEDDEHLLDIFNLLRRIFFKLTGSLLPYGSVIESELEKELINNFYIIKNSYPELFSSTVIHLAKSFNQILSLDINSMQKIVYEYIQTTSEVGNELAVVTKRALTSKEKKLLTKKVSSSCIIRFYTDNSFRKVIHTFGKVLYIGSPNYFGDYVNNTFKGSEIVFFSYDIFTNSLQSKLLLEELDNNIVQNTIYNGIILGKTNQRKIDIKLRETESVDVAVNKILEDQNILDNIQEAIEASLVYLENDRVLFVPRESKIRIFFP